MILIRKLNLLKKTTKSINVKKHRDYFQEVKIMLPKINDNSGKLYRVIIYCIYDKSIQIANNIRTVYSLQT